MANDDDIDREETRDRRGKREEIFVAIPPPRKDQTPELQAIPEQELRAACETLRAITIKILRSKRRAVELYWEVWQKLLTTRRYDPAKGPLVPWMILVAKSLYNNAVEKETRRAEHDAEAHEGFHREEAPVFTPSSEEEMLERAEAERAEADAKADAEADYVALRARAARHPIALRVIELLEEGHKPTAIAEILGVDVTRVYQASDSLRDYLKEIQSARHEARAKRDRDEKP